MINKANFFTAIRAGFFGGSLSSDVVANTEGIVDYALEQKLSVQQLAYVLATCYHETAATMRPIREFGMGKNYDYGKQLDMGRGPGQRVAYAEPKQLFYGRGYVQLTWLSNYRAAGKKLGLDLVNNPDLVLQPRISTQVLVLGMRDGWFTGKGLPQYFTTAGADPVGARRIVNGTDRAALIAGYHARFLHALTC